MLSDRAKQFISSAYKTIPLYMRKLEESKLDIDEVDLDRDWQKLPTVTKEEVTRAGAGMVMPERISDWISGRLLEVFTSGSSGQCLKVMWSQDECEKSLIPLWVYRKKDFGVFPQDKYCYFYSTRLEGKEEKEEERIKNGLGFSKNNLTKVRMAEIYNRMCYFKPVWLILQPSIAFLLLQIKKEFNLPDIESIKYIEMTGEILTPELRTSLETVFHCKVADQYGTHEVNSIAYECCERKMHCMDENVIVEVLDDLGKQVHGEEEGAIYITSLQNRTMPFLRYKTGDRGYISKEECICGRKGKVLNLTSARSTEWIITSLGERINPYVLLRPIENINRILENAIIQFQVIQRGYDDFLYKIIAGEEDRYNISSLLKKNICEGRLNKSAIRIEFCEYIFPDKKTGKVKWFISEM